MEARLRRHCHGIESLTAPSERSGLPPEWADPATVVVRAGGTTDFGRCPGTHGHRCCNYMTLNVYAGCSLGCTYCIMQSYLRNRTLEVLVPTREQLLRIRTAAEETDHPPLRVGTGEVGDSLLYDPLFDLSRQIITELGAVTQLRFELKSKTDYVDHLPDLSGSPAGVSSMVIGFSLNPDAIIAAEEGYAAPLEARLAAAMQAAQRGYRLAFHFDPLIRVDSWRELYAGVARMLATFRDAPVEWVSLGTMRFPRPLAPWIEARPYGLEEFVSSRDGKMRYLQPVRTAMYRHMQEQLNHALPGVPVYLCMESSEIWRRTVPPTPALRPIMRPVTLNGGLL